MAILKKRSLKLRWRLLLIILPVALIPISLIIVILYTRLYSYLEKEKKILNDTFVFQAVQNLNSTYEKSVSKLQGLITADEVKNNIYKERFSGLLEERDVNETVVGLDDSSGKGLRSIVTNLNITGVVCIINKSLHSLNFNRDFTMWRAGTINTEPDIDKMMKTDPMFNTLRSEITISDEGAKNGRPILGKLRKDVFADNDKYVSLLYPIINENSSPDPESTDFKVFLMLLFTNIGSGGYIGDNISSIAGISHGTIYVLDYKNDILYCNYNKNFSGEELDYELEEEGFYPKYINTDENILNDKNIQDVLRKKDDPNDDYTVNCKVINTRYNNNDYQTFIVDSNWKSGMYSGMKVVFFFPKYVISKPINDIIMQIVIFVLILIIIIFFVSTLVSTTLVNPLSRLDYATNKVSQGYLDVDIITESKDEIGSLYRNFKRMINTINEVLSNIQKSSNDLIGFQGTLNNVINDFEVSINKQAGSINSSIEEFNQLNASIKNVVSNVRNSLKLTKNSQDQVKNANDTINEMIGEINNIADTSEKISFITELINGISEQTRLLSLNAAIESSRAGDAGKGFNIVASEIRKLALQSNQAANDIGNLIKQNDKSIRAGVNKTKEVITALNEINKGFKNLTDTVNEINKAAEEESRGGQVIFSIIESFRAESEKNLKSIDMLIKTRDQLSMEVKKMRNLILAFKVQSSEKEVIYDISSDNIQREKKLKEKKKLQALKKEEREKKIKEELIKQRDINKVDSISALDNYKKKKVPFFPAGEMNRRQNPNKSVSRVNVPEVLNLDRYKYKLIPKIKDQKDLEIIEKYYVYDEFTEEYRLNEGLSGEEMMILKELFARIKFK